MTKEKALTIIVPIYNVEKFLEECLNSLLNQTSKDFFVILVNDGSTDNSLQIAKKYADTYNDLFYLVSQNNQGLGSARNLGLKYVKTKYVSFLDSDDFYGPRVVENIIDAMEKCPEANVGLYNLTVFDMISNTYGEWFDKNITKKIFKNRKFADIDNCKDLYYLEASSCRMIYKSSLFANNNIRFPVGVKWEDVPVHFTLYKHAKTFIYIGDVGAFYRINSGKQITCSNGKDRLDVIKVFSETLETAKKDDFSSKENSYIVYWLTSFAIWSMCVIKEEYLSELISGLHKIYKKISFVAFIQYIFCRKHTFKQLLFSIFMRSCILHHILKDRCKRKKITKPIYCVKRILKR